MNKDKLIALRDALLALTLAEVHGLDTTASSTTLFFIKERCDALITTLNVKPVKVYCGNADEFLKEFTSAEQYFTPAEITFMNEGKKINAIKELRGHTGMSLADAKNVIECGMERFLGMPRNRLGYGY